MLVYFVSRSFPNTFCKIDPKAIFHNKTLVLIQSISTDDLRKGRLEDLQAADKAVGHRVSQGVRQPTRQAEATGLFTIFPVHAAIQYNPTRGFTRWNL
jgi:hypothetical protein